MSRPITTVSPTLRDNINIAKPPFGIIGDLSPNRRSVLAPLFGPRTAAPGCDANQDEQFDQYQRNYHDPE